jgi:hypothetical protein
MILDRTVSVLVLAGVVVLAGCTGTLLSAEATPATLPSSAYESAGYVHGNTTAVPLAYDVGVAGVSRNVTVTSWLSGYSRTTADDRTAGLLVLSTPNVEVAGESVNPFSRLSDGAILDRVLDATSSFGVTEGMDDLRGLRRVDTTERTILDTPTNVTTYAGSVDAEGTRIGVLVHVLTVEHGDDVVVAIAVHPESMDETATVHELFERIEHDVSNT